MLLLSGKMGSASPGHFFDTAPVFGQQKTAVLSASAGDLSNLIRSIRNGGKL